MPAEPQLPGASDAHGVRHTAIKPLKPQKRTHARSWPHRPKVSACLSANFPWEIVLSFVQGHHRSVIILQMVCRSLYHSITTNHLFWSDWYSKNNYPHHFLIKKVEDAAYPALSLFKASLTGLPMHTAPFLHLLHDANFTSYVRRLFALMHGTRCGVCGCRRRHEPYWSLRMRVCKLCMAQNTISSQTLFQKYGVDYSDIAADIAGRVFYFNMSVNVVNDRVSFSEALPHEMRNKAVQYMFWLPHLSKILDLPTLRMEQLKRREAGSRITAALKRVYIISQRIRFRDRHSVDCVMLSLYRNEKRRLTNPYRRFFVNGGVEWGFPEPPHSKKCKYTFRNQEGTDRLFKRLSDWEDFVVPS